MKYMTLADKVLIVVLVILSISSIFVVPRLLTKPMDGKQIVITMDGSVIHRFPLEDTEESTYIEFPFQFSGREYTGTLELKDGEVRLLPLPREIVPLNIHNDMGWIRESYQMIVALPIKMVITVEAYEEEHPFDAISF